MFKKLFEPTPLQKWYDSLPAHTKQYVDNQAIWHDSDMWRAGLLGAAIGLIIGLLF
jgi:hypothetical protein